MLRKSAEKFENRERPVSVREQTAPPALNQKHEAQ
jgi:hypothetical protein